MDLAQELIERAKKPEITTPDLAQELIDKSRRAKHKVKYPEAGEFLEPGMKPAYVSATRTEDWRGRVEEPIIPVEEPIIPEKVDMVEPEMKPAYVSTTRTEDMPEQEVEPVAPKGPELVESAMRLAVGMITFPIRVLTKAKEAAEAAAAAQYVLETGFKLVEADDYTSPLPFDVPFVGGYKGKYKHIRTTADEIEGLQQVAKQKGKELAIDVAVLVGSHYASKLIRPILQKVRVALFSRKVSDKDLWKIMTKVTKLKGNIEGLTEFEREIWLTADQVAKDSGFRGISQMYSKMVKTGAEIKWIPKGKIGEGYWTIANYETPPPQWPTGYVKPVKPPAITGQKLNATELINAESKQMVKRGLIFTGPKNDAMLIALEKQIIPEVVGKKDIALFIKDFGGKDGYLRQLINSGGSIYDITQKLKGAFYKEYGKPIALPGEVLKEIQKETPELAKDVLVLDSPDVPKTVSKAKAKTISFQEYNVQKLARDNPLYDLVTNKGTIKSPVKMIEEFMPLKEMGLLTKNTTASSLDEIATDMGLEGGDDELLQMIMDLYFDYSQDKSLKLVRGVYKFTSEEKKILGNYASAILKLNGKKGLDKAEYLKEFNKIYEKAEPLVSEYPEALEKMGLNKDNQIALKDKELMIDDATGLLKKKVLKNLLPGFVEQGKNIMMLDLKGIRHINNTYGHETGNKVFKVFGDVWDDYITKNPGTQIARWSEGDEFVAITNDLVMDAEFADLDNQFIEAIKKEAPELAKETNLGMRAKQSLANPREDVADVMGRIDIIKKEMKGDFETAETPEVEIEDPWVTKEKDFVPFEKAKPGLGMEGQKVRAPVAKKKQTMIPGAEKREFPKEAIKPETPEEIARAKAAQEKPMPLFETAGEKGAEQLRLGSQKPPQTTADIGGYTVSPSGKLALPEIVECASDLMQGKYPYIVKHLRAAGGMATGVFGTKRGDIKLRASIFANLEEAEKTLAHEIGHLVDWLPDRDIKRGNILGRIATLKKYMKGAYESLATNKDIRTELKTLSQAWKPFDEMDAKMVKYRYSSVELYADAISVLFNDPKLLQETAPAFYRGFFDYLNRKPYVQEVYNGILETVESKETLLAHRQARMRGMYGKGEEIFAQKRAERKNKTIIGVLRHWFYDRNIAATEYIEKAMNQGLKIKPEDNPVYWIEEMVYSTAEGESYMRSVDGVHETLKKNGLSWEDLGDVLYHERVMVERATLANPLGFNPETSARQLTYIQEKLGPEKWKILQNAVKDFRKVREYVIGRIEEGHFVGKDLLKRMKEQPEYTHFLVLRHYQDKFGTDLSGWIMPQTGTLGEVANPATATVMKDMAILKDINRAQAAHKLVQLIKQVAPEEIAVPERRFNGKFLAPIKSKDPNWKLIVYPLDGELQAHYVKPSVAEIFNHSYGTIDQIGKVLSIGNKFFKELYVGINYGFMGFNLCRDFVRLVKTMPGNPFAVVYEYLKAIPSAVRRGWGMDDATIDEMLKKKMLITFGGRYSVASAEDKQIESLLRKYEIMGHEKYRSVILWPFHKLFNALHNLGQTIEMIPKVSGYRYLTKLGFNEKEVGHRVRTMAGSPDFLRKGRTAGLYNNIALFSNPMIQGWAGDIEAAKLDPMGYTAKTVAANVVPKLLMYLGSIGALGLGIKKIYDRASEYDKANYTIIPLGLTENDKAVYLRVPQDEVGRFLGGVLWKAMTTRRASDIAQLADYTAGQVPSLSPALTMGVDLAQYYTGRNPYDAFRGRYVLDQTVFEAGGWRSHKEFLKYLAKQGGINIVYRFGSDHDVQVKSELEKVLAYPILSNILGRFVKVTDYGVREQITEALQPVRQKRAEEIVLSRGAIMKIVKGEGPSEKELVALSKHPNIKERNLQILLAKRFGPAYLDMLLQAKNDEEKMVVWQTIMKLEPAEEMKALQPQL